MVKAPERTTSRCGDCSALYSHYEEYCDSAAYCFHCRDAHQFIRLRSARRELLYRQKDVTGATSYASLAARSSAKSEGLKTSATSNSLVAGGLAVHLANRFALLYDDSVEASQRCDGNPPALTKVTQVDDVHSLPVSPKPLKGLTKRYRVSAESIDLAKAISQSNLRFLLVHMIPCVTPSVSDRASCDENGLSMELSGDIITAVPREPTLAKSAVQPDPHRLVTSRNGINSQHSPGERAAVHRPGTSQLPVSSRRLIISSQVSHGQTLQKGRPSTAPK
ncbi:hypothetical protein E2C01_070451 [Portunus trituberculatus]|uniref:Uncharacterized protein n=1 Tax=Portunus trituberculatus TaxID=210409 RepID=A0A5B7HU69_PORTR|nr:hypothetical protein [Portunus trituberculatus]